MAFSSRGSRTLSETLWQEVAWLSGGRGWGLTALMASPQGAGVGVGEGPDPGPRCVPGTATSGTWL